jgi:hypothetical protein
MAFLLLSNPQSCVLGCDEGAYDKPAMGDNRSSIARIDKARYDTPAKIEGG